MENIIQIMDTPIQIKEWAGQRVITFQDIDTVHKRERGTASRNFRENRDKFIEGTDFFKIPTDEIRRLEFGTGNYNYPKGMTLITESGYLMIVKSLHDDLAWAVQRELVNAYFKAKAQAAAPVEETTVALVNHETLTQCASIMASCLEPNRPYVLNILRHIVPDIDQIPTVTVQVDEKPVEIPKLPPPEAAVVTTTKTRETSKYPYFNGKKLKALMKERRLTCLEIAERVGVECSTVSTWRSGYCPPTNINRKKLCATLGVRETYFDK